MADHISLLGSSSRGQQLTGPRPVSAGGNEQPMSVAPSIFDRFLGRGEYMNTFAKKRGVIFEGARVEKRQLLKQFRRDRQKYLEKIQRGDTKTAQRFNIRASQRHTKDGLPEREQEKLLRRSVELVKKEMREQQREAVRDIEHRRDRQVRDMRDELRDGLYNTVA